MHPRCEAILARNLARRGCSRQTGDTQGAEVGRLNSGAVKPDEKRGPKFRAPYSGYSLGQHPRLIPFKRVLPFARLGRCLSRKVRYMSEQEKHAPEAEERAKASKGKRGRRRKGMCLDDRRLLEEIGRASCMGRGWIS